MGQIVTDVTVQPLSSKSITGYRSGSTGTAHDIKNTCDQGITAFDPFDFRIDWRVKYVKVQKVKTYTRSRRKWRRNYWVIVPVPYPYYIFNKKTRTVREWRLELSAGISVISKIANELPTPHIMKKYRGLVRILQRYGPCRPKKPHSTAADMHDVLSWSSECDSFVPNGYVDSTSYQPKVTNDQFRYRFFEPTHAGNQYTGSKATEVNVDWNNQFDHTCFKNPVSVISTNISTITAMLWPSSGDFEKIGTTPLIDIAEAVSDGTFPLGPPPSPTEAHERMVKNVLSDDKLRALREVVDFSANAWLWTTLVLEPVIQSAVGLAASVEANDKAIDAFKEKAQSGKWHQGKSVRLYGGSSTNAALECGAPVKLFKNTVYGAYSGEGYLEHTFNYDKFEGNAHMAYKLSAADAVAMNSSGQRLGQYFNRMSVSLDTVLHNVLPLSFVVDWFTSSFTGTLNLQDKVYMPVDSWKVVVSHKVDVTIDTEATDTQNRFTKSSYYCKGSLWNYPPTIVYNRIGGKTRKADVTYNGISSNANDGISNWGHTVNKYSTTWYEGYFLKNYKIEYRAKYSERHVYYKRWVYLKPSRRTDFSNGYLMPCFDTIKYDPLDITGKQITLGALLWGFASK